jgi:flagellar motor switch/type III secretory pathway protein FliN
LLTLIERALMISLAPTDLRETIQRSKTGASFAIFEIFDRHLRICLAIPRSHVNSDAWIEAAQQLVQPLNKMPVLARLSLLGPRLSLTEASEIAGGDLLLFANKLPASLQALGIEDDEGICTAMSGVFDIRDGLFTNSDAIISNFNGDDMHADDDFTTAKQFGALQVPVTIRLPEKLVQAADIAELKPGGTLRLGAMVQGLVAELVIGGKILATGEIVQIGSEFALLIDERIPIPGHMGEIGGAENFDATGETGYSTLDQVDTDMDEA